MANQLKMVLVQAIIGLLEQGWPYRRIARELGIHRETVARYGRRHRSFDDAHDKAKPANPTAGSLDDAHDQSDAAPASKPANATLGSVGPPSRCQPLSAIIQQKLDQGLSAQRIWQDLVGEHGFAGSYSSVKRFIRRLGGGRPLPFRRMECPPGAEAQIDFGRGAWVVENGRKRHTHIFRIILSHSRKGYSEAVFKQDTETFIRVLENAFWAFGGVPGVLVTDNLKAVVSRADWFDPELNPKITAFAQHYGCVILPTKPYTPRHKGKVESSIKYVKNNALKGRVFDSLSAHNAFLGDWEQQVADTRIHGTTRQQVGKVFREAEQPVLLPLPGERFPCYHEGRRTVNRDGHIEVARAYYSLPPEYLGHTVWVRWDSRLVRVYNNRFQSIAIHVRVGDGRFQTNPHHLAKEKVSVIERGVEAMLGRVTRLGPEAGCWAKTMLAVRGIAGVRVLQGLLSLTKTHPSARINRACRTALASTCFRLRPIRHLCRQYAQTDSDITFTDHHPIIRPLSEYQQLLPLVGNHVEPRQKEVLP